MSTTQNAGCALVKCEYFRDDMCHYDSEICRYRETEVDAAVLPKNKRIAELERILSAARDTIARLEREARESNHRNQCLIHERDRARQELKNATSVERERCLVAVCADRGGQGWSSRIIARIEAGE